MNTDFYYTLKRVGLHSSKYPDALSELELSYNKLFKILRKYQLKQPEILKQFCLNGYNQITVEQRRIADWNKYLWSDVEKINNIEEHQIELDYYHSILTLTDDARGVLLEHITAYFPETIESKELLNELQLLNPFSQITIATKKVKQSSIEQKQPITKTDKLKAELGKYGFFELPKVKQLSEPNKQILVELISTKGLPFSIAMFDYLGFIKHLKAEHFKTDDKLFKAVANCFEVTERTVKGNIYVLNEISKENRIRYTADQQKEIVKKEYEKLK